MKKEQLEAFRMEVERMVAERERLGDFDANSPYIKGILWAIHHLVNHAIETYPEKDQAKKATPAPVGGGKKSAGKILRK